MRFRSDAMAYHGLNAYKRKINTLLFITKSKKTQHIFFWSVISILGTVPNHSFAFLNGLISAPGWCSFEIHRVLNRLGSFSRTIRDVPPLKIKGMSTLRIASSNPKANALNFYFTHQRISAIFGLFADMRI